jgi:hypothetical protein
MITSVYDKPYLASNTITPAGMPGSFLKARSFLKKPNLPTLVLGY